MKEVILLLHGRPASKKNSRVNLPDGRSFPSKAFKRFQKDIGQSLLGYKGERFKDVLLEATYVFHQKGKYTQDIDNAIASVNDVLQEFAIIDDDKNIKQLVAGIVSEAKEWSTTVVIKEFERG